MARNTSVVLEAITGGLEGSVDDDVGHANQVRQRVFVTIRSNHPHPGLTMVTLTNASIMTIEILSTHVPIPECAYLVVQQCLDARLRGAGRANRRVRSESDMKNRPAGAAFLKEWRE